MPSGKRAKQQRRDAAATGRRPPPVRSRRVRGRRASPRVLAIGASVVAVVGVGIGLGVALGSHGSHGKQPGGALPAGTPTIGSATRAGALSGAGTVARLFAGIPQHGFVLGSSRAPAQLTTVIDLQCPVCREFETTQLPTLLTKYVRTGKLSVKLEPWAFIPNGSLLGQSATVAASLQNRAFQFAELLYLNQGAEQTGWLDDAMVARAAASVDGLNVPKLVRDERSSTVRSLVSLVDGFASLHGVTATPTLLLARRGGTAKVVAVGLPTLSSLESELDAAVG